MRPEVSKTVFNPEKSFFGLIRKHPVWYLIVLVAVGFLSLQWNVINSERKRDERALITYSQSFAEMTREHGPGWVWALSVHRELFLDGITNVLARNKQDPFSRLLPKAKYLSDLEEAREALEVRVADNDEDGARKTLKKATSALERVYLLLDKKGFSSKYFDHALDKEEYAGARQTFVTYVRNFDDRFRDFQANPNDKSAEHACMASRYVSTTALLASPELSSDPAGRTLLTKFAHDVRALSSDTKALAARYEKEEFSPPDWKGDEPCWVILKKYATSQKKRALLIDALLENNVQKAKSALTLAMQTESLEN